MTTSTKTVLALDIDGVLNHFSKSAKNSRRATVGGYPISWREDTLERVRAMLARPDVEGALLSTWLSDPELYEELEKVFELEGLLPHRAAYPHMVTLGWGGVKVLADSRFEGTELNPGSSRWWKYKSAELLLEELKPARFAWVDDDLGKNTGKLDPWHPKPVTYERLLLRTHDVAGMLPADLATLEDWLNMEKEPA